MSDPHQLKLDHEPKCPKCSATLDGVTSVRGKDESPDQGDFTLCIYCATPLRFTDGLGLRLATEDDLAELDPTQREGLDHVAQVVGEALARRATKGLFQS